MWLISHGDTRDELLGVEPGENCGFTPRMIIPGWAATYNPDRKPLYNHSLKKMNLSLPGW